MEIFNKVRGVIWIVKESLIAQYGHSEPAPTSTNHPLDARYYSVVDEPQLH
jgi:hypothetical protein